jgi:hypothetical protein
MFSVFDQILPVVRDKFILAPNLGLLVPFFGVGVDNRLSLKGL